MTIRVGLVGYGFAGKVFHAPLLPAAGLELAAVASSRPDDVAADHPGVRVHPTPAALIADPEIDLVVLASPSDTHGPLMVAALEAGKHVVSDKPFTATVAEAERVMATAERCGRLASCYQNRRFDGDFLTLRGLVESGALGEVTCYRAHFEFFWPDVEDRWQQRPSAATGVHYDLGAHLVDQALVLFGMPEWVQADILVQREGGRVPDRAHIWMGRGPLRIDLVMSYFVPEHSTRYAVHGTRGSFLKSHMDPQEEHLIAGVVPGDDGYGVEAPARHGELTRFADGRLHTETVPTTRGAYERYYAGVRAAIETGAPLPVTAAEARDTIRVIEAAVRSSAEGVRVTLD